MNYIITTINSVTFPDTISIVTDTISIVKNTLQSLEKIPQIQENSNLNYIDLVAVISGAIAALAALASIFMTYLSSKNDRDSKRPYFVIEAPGFKPISKMLRLQITFINNGTHPAKNFKGEIRIFQEDLKNEVKIGIDVVNDIPSNSPTPYYNDEVGLSINMPKHFIYCKIFYTDPILRKDFNQEYFMKWNGVKNGETLPDFVHVSTSEQKIIKDFIATTT